MNDAIDHGQLRAVKARSKWKSQQKARRLAAPIFRCIPPRSCRGLAAEGRGTILHTAKTQPATFFAVCARLIPSDVKLTLSRPMVGFRPKTMRCLGQSERQSPTPTITAGCAGVRQ